MPSMTASGSWTPCRMPASSPTPSATTGPCTTARALPGICATATCSRRLKTLLAFHGPESQGHRVGAQLARRRRRRDGNVGARRIQHRTAVPRGIRRRGLFVGFGTNSGTVAAASDWDGPMEIKTVRPALPDSYERLCHEAGNAQFLLPLAQSACGDLEARLIEAAARARDRCHLPAGDGTAESLFPSGAATAVRRVHLVRRDACRDAAEDGGAGRPSGHLSVRPLSANHGRMQRHAIRRGQAGLDARRGHLAERSSISVDRCLRRRSPHRHFMPRWMSADFWTRRNSLSARSTAYSAVLAASASVKHPIATANTSITLPCGFMRSPSSAATSRITANGGGARAPGP